MNYLDIFKKQFKKYKEIKEQFDRAYEKTKELYSDLHKNDKNNQNQDNQNQDNQNQDNQKQDNQKKDNQEQDNQKQDNQKQDNQKQDNQDKENIGIGGKNNQKTINLTKKNNEKQKIIQLIYKKLSLITHPDKTNDINKHIIFYDLKKYYEEEDFGEIFYLFLEFDNKKLLEFIESKYKLKEIVIEQMSIINRRIINMKSNVLWDAYYNNSIRARSTARSKLKKLIS